MGQDQRGAIGLRDDVRHREGLAGARDALQRLFLVAPVQAVHQGGNGFRLVAGGLVRRYQFKMVQVDTPFYRSKKLSLAACQPNPLCEGPQTSHETFSHV